MRYLIIALSCTALLAGCQSSSHLAKNPAELTATLPKVDVDKALVYLINTMWEF